MGYGRTSAGSASSLVEQEHVQENGCQGWIDHDEEGVEEECNYGETSEENERITAHMSEQSVSQLGSMYDSTDQYTGCGVVSMLYGNTSHTSES